MRLVTAAALTSLGPSLGAAQVVTPSSRIVEDVGTAYLDWQKQPKAAYGVRRLDPRLEPGWTFGYYNPPTAAEATGYYYYNGSRLPDRSLLNAAGLIYHELVPGHHFQRAGQRLATDDDPRAAPRGVRRGREAAMRPSRRGLR